MISKKEITLKLLDLLPAEQIQMSNAGQAWWMNQREDGGLRLTMQGYQAFTAGDFENYEFDVPAELPLRGRYLLMLDKKLTCPYFIFLGKRPRLVLFGSQESMMLMLYGDADRFLHSLSLQ
jgi:hypothetical protein